MANLLDSPLGVNARKVRGFSNFNSRKVEFYTVYFAPKTMSFFDDYNNNVPDNEWSQLISTIGFAGVELFFIGEPAETMGPPAFIIGVNSDTSNMGDEEGMGVIISNILTSALFNAGWLNFVVKNIVDHDSIHSPFIVG